MMTDNIRMLAAIMFADMVGFTAIMQEDEAKAKSNRDKYKKILEDEIISFQGRVLQYYGDGALVIFGSAISSVSCAVSLQQKLRSEHKIPVRIGLHIGDIVYDNDGVFGDAVNIASRIESLAVPGSVLISGKLFDEIRNHPLLPAKSLGQFELKNVKDPVGIYALQSEDLIVPKPDELHGKAKNAYRSVAVLPFVNMSVDPENEFFSDGITEEIINALTKVDGLQVTARTSSFAFKGKHDDIRTIGQKLNVSTVLEGSVRKAGEKVRITAQLVNAIDGYHFWSESYNGSLEDIFDLQDEISRKIANKLIEHLAVGKVTAPLVKSATANLDAYNHCLKGIYYWNKWNPVDNAKAIEELTRAIELELKYARAYAWLANCYLLSGAMGFQKPELAYPKSKQNALKAIELDPDNDETNIAMGLVHLFIDWNWEGARMLFEKAILLNPGAGAPHHTYSMYLIAVGRIDEALVETEKAAKLDPLSLPIASNLSLAYMSLGRYDDAINILNKMLELDPNFRNALESKGYAYFLKGEFEASIAILKEYHKLAGSDNKALTSLGYVYAKSGYKEKTLEIIEKFKKRAVEEPNSSFNIDFALLYAGLKDFDNAFHYLEKAVDERSGAVIFLRTSPGWIDLRDDPRFNSILSKAGI